MMKSDKLLRSDRRVLQAWATGACMMVVSGLLLAQSTAVETVPFPDQNDMEAGVRFAVEERMDALNDAIAEGGDRSVGLAYGELGMTYHAHDMREAAAASYRNAETLVPDDSRWPYYLGNMHMEDGEFEQAAEAFRRSLALNPDYPLTEIRLARALLDAGQLSEAEGHYQASLERVPDNATAFDGLGRIALQRQDYEAAAMHFERALELQPQATRVYFLLSQAYRELGLNDQAEAALARRGDAEPAFLDPLMGGMQGMNRSFGYWTSAGNRAAMEGNYVAAAERFTMALNLRPEEPIAHVNMSRAMEALHKDDAAMIAIDRALELDPQSAEANFNKGVLLERRNDDLGARRYFMSALRTDADHYQARLLMASSLMRAGRYQDAAVEFATLSEKYPEDLQSRFRRSLALLGASQCEQALNELETLVSEQPQNPNFTEALVRTIATCPAANASQLSNARAAGEALYNYDPSLSSSEAMAMIEAANGNFEGAVDFQTQAIFLALRDGDNSLQDQLKQNMDRYRANQKAQRPWPSSHPAFSPRRITWQDRYGNAVVAQAPQQ